MEAKRSGFMEEERSRMDRELGKGREGERKRVGVTVTRPQTGRHSLVSDS